MPGATGTAIPSARALLGRVDPARRRLLESVGEAATDADGALWWVGGGVRDLLLNPPLSDAMDLDLVFSGDLDSLIAQVQRVLPVRRVGRSAFLTAELELESGGRIDLVRARSERYPEPAALPEVYPADLLVDLRRRDFTVNSLALPLPPSDGDAIVDPAGGVADLAASKLRVHHERSFEDDPTRLYRAVDFAARFGFELEAGTERLARQAVAADRVNALSGPRLRAVLLRCFGRRGTAVAALERAQALGLLAAIDQELEWRGELGATLEVALAALDSMETQVRTPAPPVLWTVLGLLTFSWKRERRLDLARRLDLDSTARSVFVDGVERVAAVEIDPRAPRSRIHRQLAAFGHVELALLAARSEGGAAMAELEVRELRRIRLAIGGDDLISRGVTPGPAIGSALANTLDERLDGRIGKDEELSRALELVASAASESEAIR